MAITAIMPTISWEGCFVPCVQRLASLLDPALDELLVVFDGAMPAPPSWLGQVPATLLSTGHRSGPGAARNLAARRARGEVLLFVDADVELHSDAVRRLRSHFQRDPSPGAVFGSYDDSPAAAGIVSRFRNLLHHHVHQCHPGPAHSFWAGCGAVRRERFLAVGGFDPLYDRPSIEDIELGRRLGAAGARILLDPTVQGTHHKRWTLPSMLVTDIGSRAIPWSRLLLAGPEASLPGTLNLEPSARWSGGATLLLALCLLTLPLLPPGPAAGTAMPAMALAALGVVLVLNRRFYGLCLRRYGPGFVLAAIPLHLLYFLYSTLTFALVAVVEAPRRRREVNRR
jgi:hypothetical protein